ncbi:LysR substrate-binding domain-containing protein [Orrella sp. JC864]|uniref:LysR family transcriptional regulator n=1 Tax=Orrella sp. JC864 TaxID=3120298 RepID=UPI00300BD37E
MPQPDLPLSQLRYFLLVAEHGSFKLAAEKAFRSQPALSKSIAALERKLGALLFEPSDRTVLTPFGRACLPYAREMLQRQERTFDTLSAMARKEMGVLSVAAIGAVAANWMPELVRGYARDYGGVSVRARDDNSENVERLVLAGEVDFGVASRISHHPQLSFEPLLRDDFGLVCSRRHRLARQPSLRWPQLAGLPLLGTTAHRQLAGTPQARYLEQPDMHVSTMLTLLSMLCADAGVTVLARLAIPAMAADKLAFVPLHGPRRYRTIGIVSRAGQSLSPAAEEMKNRLAAYAARYRA